MSTKQEVQKAGNGEKPRLVAGGGPLAIVPTDIEQCFRLAGAIAAANMAPASYNRDANAIMIGIMHGMEVGFTPMAALQSIAVINGMPTIWGDGALGLVRGSGLLEDFAESLHGQGEKMEAVCTIKRKDQTSEIVRHFSVEDAKKASLWGKKGPWQQYPQRMLQMRARSWALRDGFADVLRGLGVREEVQDMGHLEPGSDGVLRPARPTRGDFQRTVDADGDPIEPETDLRRHYVDKEARRQERDADNTARAAAGKPPIEDVDEETGEITERQEEGQPDLLGDEAITPGHRQYVESMSADLQDCRTPEQVEEILRNEEASGNWGHIPEAVQRQIKTLASARVEELTR